MKVLIVFNHPAPYKVRLFNELAKDIDLTVLFERKKANDRPDIFYSEDKYDFTAYFLNDGYVGKEGSISNGVKNYIKKHYREYDHIIMNGYSHLAEIKAIKYMQSKHIPYILLINGGVIREKEFFLKRNLKKKLISGASFYLSPSKGSNEYLMFYGAKEDKIFNYPYTNLVDTDIINKATNKNVLRKRNDLPKDKIIFISASQFIKRKNNIQLLSLFKGREEMLLLVGDGPEKESYFKYIKKNNMTNVIITSYKPKEELFELYRASDVFITLSKEDIFGHTTLEALACSIPVISSDKVMSSLEYIKNGENGFIVNLDNEQEIIDAIEKAPKLDTKNINSAIKNNTFKYSAKVMLKHLEKFKYE